MSLVHLHLILNHVPVLGAFFGAALLAWGLLRGSADTKRAGLGAIVIAALFAIPAFLTGEPAEHAVERLPGIAERAIEAHEDAAGAALAALGIAGGVALATLVLERLGRGHRALAPATLGLAIVASALMAWTAMLGGRIHHAEIGVSAVTAPDRAARDRDD